MADRVVLIGGGALARDIVETAGADRFCGVLVEPGFASLNSIALPLLHSWEEAAECGGFYVLGVLDAALRCRLRQRASDAGLRPAPAMVSPRAVVSAEAVLGPGSLIGNHVQIGAMTQLEADVLVMHNAVVGHNTVIGANTVVLPGAWIGGYVQMGSDCFIGANSVISPGLVVGKGASLAPGAACFRNLPDHALLVGNPGRVSRSPVEG